MTGPRETYSEGLALRRSEQTTWEGLARRLSWGRLVVFVLFGVVVVLRLSGVVALPSVLLLIPAITFGVLVWWHGSVHKRLERSRLGVAYYEAGQSRLDGTWVGKGCPGTDYLPPTHLYARDLDLFGDGSLYERLCTVGTRAGESILADWLLSPATAEVVAERQAAATELAKGVGLREELYVLARDVRLGVSPARLSRWGQALPALASRWPRLVAPLLVTATLFSLVGVTRGWFGGLWLVLCGVLQAGFAVRMRGATRHVREGELLARELGVLARMLDRLATYPMSAPLLTRLQSAIRSGGQSPAAVVRKLAFRLEMLEASRNQLFAVVSPLLLWGTQWGLAIESWRLDHGAHLGRWLAAAGELEALLALACYAYETPDGIMPAVAREGLLFEAKGLGHPLLPGDACVRNDVHLSGDRPLLIVSGSNMSGKSTLLRTVGISAVLAQAGAPVRAESLRLGPLAVGASIRVEDSLRDGKSRFYAEICRLRDIMEGTGRGHATLFLLDEILHGTNSHDRGVGTAAVLGSLVERHSIGLVTTHDLALSAIAEDIRGAANVHFADDVIAGEMTFDYQMRSGVVERSNAIALMRSLGLPV